MLCRLFSQDWFTMFTIVFSVTVLIAVGLLPSVLRPAVLRFSRSLVQASAL